MIRIKGRKLWVGLGGELRGGGGESARVTTLRLLTNDSRSRGARIQGGWRAIISDGGYEAKSTSSGLV